MYKTNLWHPTCSTPYNVKSLQAFSTDHYYTHYEWKFRFDRSKYLRRARAKVYCGVNLSIEAFIAWH